MRKFSWSNKIRNQVLNGPVWRGEHQPKQMKSRKKGAKKVVRTQRLKEFTLKFYCFILPLFVALRWHLLSSIYVECSMNSWGYLKQIWAQGCWIDAEFDTVQKLALEVFCCGRVSKTCVVTLKSKMSSDRCLWNLSVTQFAPSTQFRKDSECLIEVQTNCQFLKVPNFWRSEV